MIIYVNTDGTGHIIETFGGSENVIPDREYEYEFAVSLDVLLNIHLYKVENELLTLK
ncbi:hypothetical protein ACFFJY_08100 [Fictibacillus aquaticus]|uniref:hypothetical protein n=1 Tax=Fictibacillus aquaticus TaxID=2021314 RepID=UPI0013FD3E8C|nr:hypothetical protein [Fictibacillus aquaticus]